MTGDKEQTQTAHEPEFRAGCPRCGAKKHTTAQWIEGKGYLLTLQCAEACGWREVL